MTLFHMCVSIEGLKSRLKTKSQWQIFSEDGRLLDKKEVVELIKKHESLGHDSIPTCDSYDSHGYCTGHEEPVR